MFLSHQYPRSAPVGVGVAPAGVGSGKPGVQADGLIVFEYRLVEVSLLEKLLPGFVVLLGIGDNLRAARSLGLLALASTATRQ